MKVSEITSNDVMKAIKESGSIGLSLADLAAHFGLGSQEQEDDLRLSLYYMVAEGRIKRDNHKWVPDPNYGAI